MTIAPAGVAPEAAPTRSTASLSKLAEDYDSFLTLLTAQVQNQDPLKPADPTQFVSQLAQMTQVEQSIVANGALEDIGRRLAAMGSLSDVQLIGREVQLASDTMVLEGGTTSYAYEPSSGATSVTARILSSDGELVREITGLATSPGTQHALHWDGMDRDDLPVPDGTFRVEFVGLDAEGEDVAVRGFATTKVERVEFSGDGAELVLGNGETVLSSTVRAVF